MKLHNIQYRDWAFQVETWFEYPPISPRDHDYGAHLAGYEPPDPIGWGRTEDEAITDLLMNLDLETEEWLSSRSSSLPAAS